MEETGSMAFRNKALSQSNCSKRPSQKLLQSGSPKPVVNWLKRLHAVFTQQSPKYLQDLKYLQDSRHTPVKIFPHSMSLQLSAYTPENEQAVTNRRLEHGASECYTPLFELQKKRQLLEVINQGKTYQSFILDTNIANKMLILDDLFPSLPENSIRIGDTLTIRHHHHNKVLAFSSVLLDIVHNLSAPMYVVELPDAVAYHQRRQHPRVTLSQEQPLTVKLQSPLSTPWFATAVNLSCQGIRLNIGGNITNHLNRDTLLPCCEFQFNQNFAVRCQLSVKAFRFVRKPHRHTQISAAFIGMAPQQYLQLQQFIATLQQMQYSPVPA
jgi:c-di-GMP-binding flagellar brake protein YcgR